MNGQPGTDADGYLVNDKGERVGLEYHPIGLTPLVVVLGWFFLGMTWALVQ